jgi:hypothetical protein
MFKDENGLPVALDGDGGDTLQRCGAWAAGLESTGASARPFARYAVAKLYVGGGEWRRHPGRPGAASFWSDPKWISRDQLLNAVVVSRIANDWRVLIITVLKTTMRLGFAPNWKDQCLGQSSLFIRCLFPLSIPLWPLLLITDLMLLIGVMFDAAPYRWKHEEVRFIKRTSDDSDVDNAVLQYFVAWRWMPTPISWAARFLHSWAMPETLGTGMLGISNKLAGAMLWKHRPGALGDQDLAQLWRPWIEEFTWTKKQPPPSK